jgi:polyphosphate glucokinase
VKTLVIDVGGTHVKVLASGKRVARKIDSGPTMTAGAMARAVLDATADWEYDRISIGYPGPVRDGKPAAEPWNLAPGWVRFNYRRAFKRPVRMINDAAMQALGSYHGGNMLFLGLGTGMGSAMIRDSLLIPLELAHLPYHRGKTYEEYVGARGLRVLGKHRWRQHVLRVIELFVAALEVDYVVLGGGNARRMKQLPSHVELGSNANAFKGGFRLWQS